MGFQLLNKILCFRSLELQFLGESQYFLGSSYDQYYKMGAITVIIWPKMS